MTQEQWLALKVLELQDDNHDLYERLTARTLEVAQLSERIDFLLRLLAELSGSVPVRDVSLEEFSMLAQEAS